MAAVAALAAWALLGAPYVCRPAQEGHVIAIARGEHQLFVDDVLIDSMERVRRTWHQPNKHPGNPILVPDGPGEEAALLFGTVMRDEDDGLFRMWYLYAIPGGPGTGYATSADGVHWTKPDLGLFEIAGTSDNNVCLFDWPTYYEIAGVLRNPVAKGPDDRFVMVVMGRDGEEKCYHVLASPDGVRWKEVRAFVPPAPMQPDRACLVWDPSDETFTMYARCKHIPEAIAAREGDTFWGRAVALIKSKDLTTWTDPIIVMSPDAADPLSCEIYSLMAWPYGGMWLGLAQTYYSEPSKAFINVQFAFSRDGVHWTRQREKPFERPFLPLGKPGRWDRFNNAVAGRPVQVGDRLHIYYSGRTYRHGGYQGEDKGTYWGAVGLATLRLDGFCSLDGSFDGAAVTTKPLRLPAGQLHVNAACNFGSLVVEALDEEGNPLEGCVSRPLEADGVRLPVVFPAGEAPTCLSQAPVRLRFLLRNARLFSFWVE